MGRTVNLCGGGGGSDSPRVARRDNAWTKPKPGTDITDVSFSTNCWVLKGTGLWLRWKNRMLLYLKPQIGHNIGLQAPISMR